MSGDPASPPLGPQRRASAARPDRARLGGVILLGLLILSCIALIFSAASFDRRLNEVRDADTDNQGWIVSQLEVDHLSLMVAASDALASAMSDGGVVDPQAWQRLQSEFDIFYSRVGVFIAATRNTELSPEFETDLSDLQEARDLLTAQIDQLDPEDRAGLEAFVAELRRCETLVRSLVTQGLQVFITEAQVAREREREIWKFFLIETLTLLSLVLVASVFALRLSRALQQRTKEAERAASTITKAYEASLSAVVVTDFDGRVLLCNKAAESMFRLPMAEIIGIDALRLAPARLQPALGATYDGMRQFATRDTPCRVARRTLAVRSDGDVFPVELALTTDTDADGMPIAIAFVRDISAEVQAERALRGAVDEARRAAAAKSMFLATMSHEMRTPLHGLIAALDLIERDGIGADDLALLDTARDCSQRALAQVNDVLQFTRASATREPAAPFRPARVVGDVIGELRPFARENGNSITLTVTGDGSGERVIGHPAAFSRAIYNLVGNAVKFTAGGKITVTLAFSAPDDTAPLTLCVSVEDEGPGIAKADQERIFHLFETTAEAGSAIMAGTSQSGTGLGLPITKLAVERMGGQIHLDSTPGQGSRFWFEIVLPRATGLEDKPSTTLPLAATPAEAPQMPAGLVWDILVVDDNEVNLTLMLEMVRRLGHRTAAARNGKEAVTQARARAFDVILMDVSMPVMDGREATRAIRAEGASQHAAILGVTALIEAEDPDSFRDCGMDRALVKPVRRDTLTAALAEIAHTHHTPTHVAEDLAMDTTDTDLGTDLGFDFAGLSDLVGADTALRLVDGTIADAQEALQRARDGNAGLADIGHAAHRAFGSASMVGWQDLAAVLREIEQAALAREAQAIPELAEDLAAMIDEAQDDAAKLADRRAAS